MAFWEKSSWLKSLIHFNRTFSYALLSTAGIAGRLMACALVLFSAVYSD